ncbi:hypothetical protein [Acidiphilium sp.]|uniref:hypothetical protein n=1 Tax=Acidiphilium sp. TaxID=527 RepID=UPI0025900208|nr:hypothetical protein [Acidiphilium sp.]
MLEGENDGGSGLLDAFLASAADHEGEDPSGLPPPNQDESANAAQPSGEETEEEEGEGIQGAEETAEGAETETDGDFVEFEGEDGEPTRVPLDQLIEGYKQSQQFGSNANQIRHEVTEAAQAFVRERVQRLDKTLDGAVQAYNLVQKLVPQIKEPDPAVYLNPNSPHYDPEGYAARIEGIRQIRQIMQDAEGGLKTALEQRRVAAQEEFRMNADRHWVALQNADPTWKKGDAAQRMASLRSDVGSAYGFSAEELGTIVDHRFVLMAQHALAFQKAQKATIAPKAKTPPKVIRGAGNRGGKADTKEAQRRAKAREDVRKTGRTSDLEAFWGEHLS